MGIVFPPKYAKLDLSKINSIGPIVKVHHIDNYHNIKALELQRLFNVSLIKIKFYGVKI
ncbi:hypothetical protein AP1H75_04300 [Apilactobacillus apinorum]